MRGAAGALPPRLVPAPVLCLGADQVQLYLFRDYRSNVALYPAFQQYFRARQPPFLAVWGRNDPFFLPPGAKAFKRDISAAIVQFVDTGHFALETHAVEIAQAMRAFLLGLPEESLR